MNIIQLYQDYNVIYTTEGNKHCRPGWVQVDCPFCAGSKNMHLGYNLSDDFYTCWRCGWHPVVETVSKLIGTTEQETRRIIRNYDGFVPVKKEPKVVIRKKAFKFPSGTTELQPRHWKYLIEKRGFDPVKLINEWDIRGTGPVSELDGTNYKNRILIPIYWDGVIVSFQARDISDKSDLKYMACPEDRELIHHKHILFGKQSKWKDTCICVEGIFDVFRFGVNSFASLGTGYTEKQLRLIAKTFKRVPVVFDNEAPAKKKADKLISELRFRGVDSFRVDVEDDPGSMKQSEADYLVKQLIN